MNKALLIVDIQNDYFENGSMALAGSTRASEHARLMLEKFRMEGIPVIHVKHIATQPGSTFFLPGTPGAAIHKNVFPLEHEKVVIKHYPNSFRDTELLDWLRSRDITDLVICGMMTHMCIDATVRAARDFGFRCTVIGDACATRDLEIRGEIVKAPHVQNSFLAALHAYYAEVITASEYLKTNVRN